LLPESRCISKLAWWCFLGFCDNWSRASQEAAVCAAVCMARKFELRHWINFDLVELQIPGIVHSQMRIVKMVVGEIPRFRKLEPGNLQGVMIKRVSSMQGKLWCIAAVTVGTVLQSKFHQPSIYYRSASKSPSRRHNDYCTLVL
jgi:hypothetical protein